MAKGKSWLKKILIMVPPLVGRETPRSVDKIVVIHIFQDMITPPLSFTIAPFKIVAISKMFVATHDHLQGIPEEKKGTKSKIVTKTAVVEELAQKKPSGDDGDGFDDEVDQDGS